MSEHGAILGINMASIFGGIFLIWDNGVNQCNQWVVWDLIYIYKYTAQPVIVFNVVLYHMWIT